jgi:DNA-binding NtrC family response regulator
MERLRVLVVDDDPELREFLAEALTEWGYEATPVSSGEEALERIGQELVDLALVDISMIGMDGIEVLREIRRRDLDVDVVMMTGRPTVSTAVQALRLGAYDYFEKPLSLEELEHFVGKLAEQRLLRREVSELRRRLGEHPPRRQLVGASPAMEQVRRDIEQVATSDTSVLIEGESGTGKELVATEIHRRSSRRERPFMPVNCGAIPGDLMESQFFGHVRGAFSGAVADTPGLFRSADGGTLFLDEVGELPLALQVKLLRALQERVVQPVGSTKSHAVDVRVIAATNRRLDAAVADGSFRQDLFYRLNVVRLVIPPLRDRREDVPALVAASLRQLNQRFGREVKRVTPEAMAALMAYDFPGNVRELENVLERAYALGARGDITVTDLPALPARAHVAPSATKGALAQTERDLIERALRAHADKDEAARALGMSRRTLYRRLQKYGLG